MIKPKNLKPQHKNIQTLNVLKESTASLPTLEKNLGLNKEDKTQLKSLMVEKAIAEKKLGRLKSLAKSQQKLREKRKQIIKDLPFKYSEVGSKFKKS